jgi:hypothetical protein
MTLQPANGISAVDNPLGSPSATREIPPARITGHRTIRAAQAKGMVACTVVLVLTGLLSLLRVVTVSVTWTVTDIGAASLLFGLPDSTPAEESFMPLGRLIFFHFSVVE